MLRKVVLGVGAAGMSLAMLPLLAAFEAHVVNVTARIENALLVPVRELTFGTVFPQEKLDKFFDVRLSQSFQDEDRVDDVDYFIRQKPKCGVLNDVSPFEPKYLGFTQATHNPDGSFSCPLHSELLPLLCPYLSKHEVTGDGANDTEPGGATENDGEGLAAFHGPIDASAWTLAVAKLWDVKGHLAKSQQDFDDRWNVDLKVPCFGNHCAQDWATFVADNDGTNNANPADYIQPIANEHLLFGCDLWLEVGGISLPGIGCNEQADVMLVLDRSGSIDETEMTTLKNAAKDFVDALAPSPTGVHMGQTSFSATGSLDTHLTDDVTTIKNNIDEIVPTTTTNLAEGISLAKTEQDNPGDGDDRTDGTSPDFMVIITDGNPNQPGGSEATGKAAATAAADAAKAAGIEIFVLGVGDNLDADYLKTIATDDAHYFDVANFDDLEAALQAIANCND